MARGSPWWTDQACASRQPVYHFLNTSTFTEYTVLDAACAVKINPKAPLDRMYLLSCGVSTGKRSIKFYAFAKC